MIKKITIAVSALLTIFAVAFFAFAPRIIDKSQNQIEAHAPYVISEQAKRLHDTLIIGDWHADSTLWNRDLSQRNSIGHVDLPRMREGNMAIQMFTTVTKSPSGLNYNHNKADAADDITKLALGQRWPMATWNSLTARALHQANKLKALDAKDENFVILKSQKDLHVWFESRQKNKNLVAGLIGTEGSHALDGKLENVQILFDAGFRMMSLQHFFDNKLGASLHGSSQAGLTQFGRDVLAKIDDLNIILDVAHSSEAVVADVLSLRDKPVVVSHTGFNGHCESPRNISDSLMQKIAAKGGLIAVGFWSDVVCGPSASDVAKAIKYGIQLVGVKHVALGSDYDGSVKAIFDVSEMAALTQALLNEGVSEVEIRQVMGGNMLAFLLTNLPPV